VGEKGKRAEKLSPSALLFSSLESVEVPMLAPPAADLLEARALWGMTIHLTTSASSLQSLQMRRRPSSPPFLDKSSRSEQFPHMILPQWGHK